MLDRFQVHTVERRGLINTSTFRSFRIFMWEIKPIFPNVLCYGCRGDGVVSVSKTEGLDPSLAILWRVCMLSNCLLGFSPGTLASSNSPKMQIWISLIGDAKLTVGVNHCLSLYGSPAIRWWPSTVHNLWWHRYYMDDMDGWMDL